MEELGAIAIGALALLAAGTVHGLVGVRSAKRGDGILLVWMKSGCAGGLAMIGVVGSLFVVGKVVEWLNG